MTEEMQNTDLQQNTEGQVSEANVQAESIQTNDVPKGEQPVQAPEVSPEKIDRLAHMKDFDFKDKNGYVWHYKLQYPGLMKHQEIYDEARGDNGQISYAKLHELYLRDVVVEPYDLTTDDFNTRPGFFELMDAVDTFLAERSNL